MVSRQKYFIYQYPFGLENLISSAPEDVEVLQYSYEDASSTEALLNGLGLVFCCLPSFIFWRDEVTVTNPEGLSSVLPASYVQMCLRSLDLVGDWESILEASTTYL